MWFQKCFKTQHCLLLMFEKRKNALNKKKVFGAVLTELSKLLTALT